MRNLDKARELVNANATVLEEWLENAHEVREFEPYVQQAYANTTWHRDSLNVIPDDAPDIDERIVRNLENSKTVFIDHLPRIVKPKKQYTDVTSLTATVISGSLETFDYLNLVSPNLSPEQQGRINQQIVYYKRLQERENRISNVKNLLNKLDKDLVDQMESAEKELSYFKNGTTTIAASAGALRNVLQHFKGQVLLRARNSPKDTTNWSDMAKRICIAEISSPEHKTLAGEEMTNSQLYNKLSLIFKGDLKATSEDLENIYVEIVDHFYTVLLLIRI